LIEDYGYYDSYSGSTSADFPGTTSTALLAPFELESAVSMTGVAIDSSSNFYAAGGILQFAIYSDSGDMVIGTYGTVAEPGTQIVFSVAVTLNAGKYFVVVR
jgi:hypothetical protein